MINRVVLVGRITKDPELRMTQSNIPVVSFTLAVNRTFANQAGEREADFIRCVVWRRQAETLAQFIKKGALLGVEGRIQTGSYENDNKVMVYTTDVVCDSIQFLESRTDTESSSSNYDNKPNESNDSESDDFYKSSKILAAEDDLPF